MAELTRGVRAYVLIGLIAFLSALAGMFTMPPMDRDESRFAQATAQMLETGDFVSINFLDEERNKKPIGIHWMQAAAVAAVSDADARQIWAYRIPSMLGIMLAALACFWGGIRVVGRDAALAGSTLFAACLLLGIEGGIAKTDAMLAGCTTLAMAALANLRFADGGRKTSLLFWVAIGLGTLIKGPVTPMVAGLALVALLAWERKARWMKPLLFWPGPVIAILMVLPWLIAVQIATDGNFLREALGDDLGPKLVSGHERHGGPIGYHLLLLPILFFPAVLFLVPGVARVIDAVRHGDETAARAARFLIAWAVPTWLVFEILPTKLPHYVLPAYPALALAAGWGFVELLKARAWERWVSWGFFAVGGFLFSILLPVAFVIYGGNVSWDAVRLALVGYEAGFDLTLDPVMGALVTLCAVLLAAMTAATLVADRLKPASMLVIALAVLAGLSLQLAGRGAGVGSVYALRLADQVRAARAYSETIAGVAPGDIVTASSFTEPSLVFSLGSDTVLGTTEEVLSYAESRSEPVMVVLDLSRDPDLLRLMRRYSNPFMADPTQGEMDALRLWMTWNVRMRVCHEALAGGLNYSRGDETTLLILFTGCEGARRDQSRLGDGAVPDWPEITAPLRAERGEVTP